MCFNRFLPRRQVVHRRIAYWAWRPCHHVFVSTISQQPQVCGAKRDMLNWASWGLEARITQRINGVNGERMREKVRVYCSICASCSTHTPVLAILTHTGDAPSQAENGGLDLDSCSVSMKRTSTPCLPVDLLWHGMWYSSSISAGQ